jgi:thiamine kinase-like enzyme
MSSSLPISRFSSISPFVIFATPQLNSCKTKITAGIAFGAFLLLARAYHFAREKKYATSIISLDECIKRMLPSGEEIQKMEKVEGGFSNNLWRVDTKTKSYILRSPKKKYRPSDFIQILEVSKHAFKHGISPEVFGEDRDNQHMLLEYIENVPWPSYEENFEPYKATMKVLKCFHENMQSHLLKEKEIFYAPFTLVFNEIKGFEKSPIMPIHFSRALKKVEIIQEQLKPWLKNHATLCHGDFHKGNVLLSKKRKLMPLLIDFDSTPMGDPIFDVVKFSVALPHKYRIEMFSEYLGGRFPTKKEHAHFELMDLALLMVIVIVRFKSAQSAQGPFQEYLTKEEMEEMLDSKEPLPSFLTMSFGDTSPKARQKGAVYALGEFLKRSEALSFSETLRNFNV